MFCQIIMNFIDKYIELRENDKELIKSFLIEILDLYKKVKNEKGKKFINQDEIDDTNKRVSSKWSLILTNKWVKLEDIKWKNFEDFIWVEKWEKVVWFPVYLWKKETIVNDNKYFKRLSILEFLEKNNVIRISDFNLIEAINSLKNDKDLKKLYWEEKEILIKKYWKEITERQLKWLRWKEKYFQYIIFNKENIKESLKRINNLEIKEFEYRDKVLFYWWKIIYTPEPFSDRDKFLELFFSEKKLTYFKINDIFNYIEWWASNKYYLEKEEDKKIRNIKDKINNKIEKETKIKKFFFLWKWDNKGKICRNY